MSLRLYIASRYGRHKEMSEYAATLREIGYDVHAEWITGIHDGAPDVDCALIDVAEVRAADVLVSFTEAPGPAQGRGRGGRHVEFGIAFALGKRCIVVGYRENVFHHHPDVEFYATFEELIEVLS